MPLIYIYIYMKNTTKKSVEALQACDTSYKQLDKKTQQMVKVNRSVVSVFFLRPLSSQLPTSLPLRTCSPSSSLLSKAPSCPRLLLRMPLVFFLGVFLIEILLPLGWSKAAFCSAGFGLICSWIVDGDQFAERAFLFPVQEAGFEHNFPIGYCKFLY